jgi:phospholipase/carboxylesterase
MSDVLEAIEIETASNPHGSVIWLHGLGADGNNFVPMVDELDCANIPLRFVFPHAPLRPVSINYGAVMRSWYDITFDDLLGKTRGGVALGIHESQAQLDALIMRENARGVATRNIVLAGFSQGGAVALHSGLRYPEEVAGILALSTYLPRAADLAVEATPSNRKTSIFLAHGIFDTVIPLVAAISTREALVELNYRVEWREYSMAHALCAEEIADISKWLKWRLASHPTEK